MTLNERYHIYFNNKTSTEIGLNVVSRPIFPSPKQRTNNVTIPGRDGTLTEVLGYEDIAIPIEFNCIKRQDIHELNRQINQWLYAIVDNRLILSDNPDFYYRVKKIVVDDKKRRKKNYMNFTATFTCEPYQYSNAGAIEIKIPSTSTIYNVFPFESYPIIRIKGEGLMQLEINDQILNINVGQQIIIDSEKKLTYRNDGTLENQRQKGAYPVLSYGENRIKVSGGRLDALYIKTNSRTI